MIIEFNRVSKSYGKHNKALSDVSFAVDAGEMLFLTGHSGAGKTSIMKLIMKIEDLSYGQATVNGFQLLRRVYGRLGFACVVQESENAVVFFL